MDLERINNAFNEIKQEGSQTDISDPFFEPNDNSLFAKPKSLLYIFSYFFIIK